MKISVVLVMVVLAMSLGCDFADGVRLPSTSNGPVKARFSNSDCTDDVVYEEADQQFVVSTPSGALTKLDEKGVSFYSFFAYHSDTPATDLTHELLYYRWELANSA
jgi:hypothetical protein